MVAGRGTWVPRQATRRPVTVAMLFIAIVVLGAIAYLEIPLQLLPSGYTPPFLFVQLPSRPTPPRDLEETVAKPVEDAFGTVANLHQSRTWINSTRVGLLLEFKEGTDMDVAYNQVRDRLDRVIPSLPEDLGHYYIWKYNPSNDPVYWLGASLPEGIDQRDVSHLLETKLVRKLERVPGVSRVEIEGAQRREVQIEVDDKRASAAGLGVAKLIQDLQRDNFALAGGVIADGTRRLPIRVVARYDNLEALRKLPVGAGLVRLGDVAHIGYATPDDSSVYRVNGKRGVIVQVFKESSANTVEVCEAVKAVVTSKDPELADFEFVDFFNRGFYIQQSLDNLVQTLLWGGLFAVLVLLFFLRQLRVTLVIFFAIPISILVTLVVMFFSGASLNSLSLMGLMLSVGMVVDNSIVVVENIQRARQTGLGPLEAAIAGAGEVSLAIVVATGTSVVVFLPLILMSGSRTLSFFMGKIGYPVCIALVASLFVSLVFIPLAASSRLGRADTLPPRLKFLDRFEGWYGALLSICLRRRVDAVIVALAVFASMFFPLGHLKETDTKGGNPNDFSIYVNFDPNFTFSERDSYLRRAEHALLGRDDLGIANVLTRFGGEWGRARIRVFMVAPDERSQSREALIEQAQELLPKAAGVTLSTKRGDSSGDDSITVQVQGPDSGRLEEIASDVSRRLSKISGVKDVASDGDDSSASELRLTVDRDLAERQGLSPLLVGLSIDYAIRGRRINDFHAADREVQMVVLSPKDKRESLQDLNAFALRSPLGAETDIGHVTHSEVAASYRSISREDKNTVVSLVVTADDDDLARLGKDIDDAMVGYVFPRGYSYRKGVRFQQMQTNASERSFALTLAILLVFLLMGILFESFVLPISIVLSIPFAFVGVYWVLYLTGTQFDVMAGVGLVILIGVVVNNAVVLVDLVNQLRRSGVDRTAAIIEAGQKRLRPILMTALTTICGLLPMSLGSAALIGIPYAPLGRALIGGLVASTVLTLVVVPLFYTLFDDLSRLGRGLAGVVLRPRLRKGRGGAVEGSDG